MTSLTRAVAPDLVFEFRDIEPRLSKRIADFLDHYPPVDYPHQPLVVSADPAPVEPRELELVLVEENLEIKRSGSITLFESTTGTSAWCDSGEGRAGISVEDASDEGLEYFAWRVLAGLLMELAEARDWIGLHAAAAVVDGKGLLFTGPSGVGKSTLITRLHAAGHGVLSDDLMWLSPELDAVEVVAFPRAPARATVPLPTVSRCSLDAIICPRIVDREASSLSPLSTADLLDVLVGESGFLGAAPSRAKRFRALLRLAEDLPGFRLEAGRRQERIPPLLANLSL